MDMKLPVTDVSLIEDMRNLHESRLGRTFTGRFRLEYLNHSTIYTAGSKSTVGAEALQLWWEISHVASVFTAEVYAILMACKTVSEKDTVQIRWVSFKAYSALSPETY